MTFQMFEIIWYILIPILFIPLFIFRKWTRRVGYAECLLPALILSIEMLNRLLFPFSIWAYILFVYTWIGVIQLAVNYRTDLYFTFGEFFRKWFKLICVVNIFIWFVLVAWRVASLFLT